MGWIWKRGKRGTKGDFLVMGYVYSEDVEVSKRRDLLLMPYFSKRYRRATMVEDVRKQRAGGDIAVKPPRSPIQYIDTKHETNPQYLVNGNFFLEEESNSITHVPGWILSKGAIINWVYYMFWNEEDDILLGAWRINFPQLRDWFIENRSYFKLSTVFNGGTSNRTTGRLVKRRTLEEDIEVDEVTADITDVLPQLRF